MYSQIAVASRCAALCFIYDISISNGISRLLESLTHKHTHKWKLTLKIINL